MATTSGGADDQPGDFPSEVEGRRASDVRPSDVASAVIDNLHMTSRRPANPKHRVDVGVVAILAVVLLIALGPMILTGVIVLKQRLSPPPVVTWEH